MNFFKALRLLLTEKDDVRASLLIAARTSHLDAVDMLLPSDVGMVAKSTDPFMFGAIVPAMDEDDLVPNCVIESDAAKIYEQYGHPS